MYQTLDDLEKATQTRQKKINLGDGLSGFS